MKTNWTYRDIINLEYCLGLDSGQPQDALHRRDRAIYLDCCQDGKSDSDNSLLTHWLRARTRAVYAAGEQQSPGEQFESSLRLLSLILYGVGLLLGFGAGQAFFSYSGTTPVNVFHFLFLFIFSQLLMLLLLLGSTMLRLFGLSKLPSLITRLYTTLITALSGPRSDTARVDGLLRRLGTAYGSLLYWPLFILSQKFMVCLNSGLLAATLLKISTTDQAFGWQSTIQLSVPFVHRFVELLAAPWSWLVPEGYAFPSQAEIEGSRIILKDGAYHLATQDLVSWWPFLVFALLTYGLLLRLLLILVGRLLHYRSRRRLNLQRPELLRVIQRMRTPLLSSGGTDNLDRPSGFFAARSGDDKQAGHREKSNYPLLALIPDDVVAHCPAAAMDRLLQYHGIVVSDREIIRLDEPISPDLIQRLTNEARQSSGGLLIILEAWQPPINDWLHLLKETRAAVGSKVPIFVGLLGRPGNSADFAPPAPQDSLLWRRRIAELGDPFLTVTELDGTDRLTDQDSP